MRRILVVSAPLILLGGLVVLLYVGMQDRDDSLPSPLIGKPTPALPEPDGAGVADRLAEVREGIHLVNFWASWCQPCLAEHPRLMALARDGVPIVGVNYKDAPEAAQRWLARHGDPFTVILRDPAGTHSINWGVYGVPETYIVDGAGNIVYKQVGVVDAEFEREELLPRLNGAGS